MDRVRSDLVRGDVWEAEFDPIRGREQAGRRPAVILSSNILNQGSGGLVLAIPLTSRDRQIRLHVPVQPPEGGLTTRSFVMCEQLRVCAVERFLRRRGSLSDATIREVEERVRILLDL